MARRFGSHLSVPDGWFDYLPYGDLIGETKIIAVKTPLKKSYNNGLTRKEGWVEPVDYRHGVCTEDEFTPQQMVDRLKDRGLKLTAVIDLTFTSRYYHNKEFKDLGVSHTKIKCPGKVVPSDEVYVSFAKTLNEFLKVCDDPGSVVAVHCTHGLNRTGYLVCRYLMQELKLTADKAIAEFNRARGYPIERENYLVHLRQGCPPLPSPEEKSPVKATTTPSKPWRQDPLSQSPVADRRTGQDYRPPPHSHHYRQQHEPMYGRRERGHRGWHGNQHVRGQGSSSLNWREPPGRSLERGVGGLKISGPDSTDQPSGKG